MRTYLWIAYALVLLALFFVAERRNRPGGYVVATAPLGANRLILDGDVRFGGGPLYLRRRIAAGDPIRAGDVGPWPSLQLPAGSLAIGLPLRPPTAGTAQINAGDRARICPPGPNLAAPLPILAVLCNPAGNGCTAIAAATPQQATAIAARAASNPTLARTCQ